jgi:uncharacterized membrane protein
MSSGKTKLLVLVAFALALVGGGAAGMLAARYVARPTPVADSGNVPLSDELQLSPSQRDQIRVIWLGMQDTADNCYREAQRLDRQEHDAIISLLIDEQKKQYEKIHQDYQDRYTANTARRQAAFDQAVDGTKKLLDDSQRRRYEQILAGKMGREIGQDQRRPEPQSAQAAPGGSAQ